MFTESIIALITPMDKNGNVYRTGLKKLIDYHVVNGTSAIVSVGTTDESATLGREGHSDVVMMTLELTDERIPVIAGAGANATAEAISLTKRFNDNGVVDCLTVTPYYNRPTREGLFQHFEAIAKHTNLPQTLYSVPSRTGCDMLPEIAGRLMETRNIVGTKEATGNLSRVRWIKELVSDDSILLSGGNATGTDFMQLGGVGAISVATNVAAREMADMYRLTLAGRFVETRVTNQHLMPLHTKLFVEPNSIPVKWECKALGLVTTDTLRLPMTPITDHGCEAVTVAPKHADLL